MSVAKKSLPRIELLVASEKHPFDRRQIVRCSFSCEPESNRSDVHTQFPSETFAGPRLTPLVRRTSGTTTMLEEQEVEALRERARERLVLLSVDHLCGCCSKLFFVPPGAMIVP